MAAKTPSDWLDSLAKQIEESPRDNSVRQFAFPPHRLETLLEKKIPAGCEGLLEKCRRDPAPTYVHVSRPQAEAIVETLTPLFAEKTVATPAGAPATGKAADKPAEAKK